MEKKEKQRLLIIFGMVFFLALYVDLTQSNIKDTGVIIREAPEGEVKTVDLLLEAEGLLEKYYYQVEISPQKLTQEEIRALIEKAKSEIQESILVIEDRVPVDAVFGSSLVETDWYFSPGDYIKGDGTILFEKMEKEKILLTVSVNLSCGDYEEIYQFPLKIVKPKLSKEEALLQKIQEFFQKENLKEGEENLSLPKEIDGVALQWSEPKDNLALKVLFLEVVAVGVIFYSRRKERILEAEKRAREIELTYSNIVNQLVILLEAGMTTRQAWLYMGNLIAGGEGIYKPVADAIGHLNQKLKEGESEGGSYEQFGEELGVFCYRRLMRTLTGNLEKGNLQLCKYLEEESRRAYEERILLAKKMGEEASTRMLLPLMIMLVLVMGVVLMPAIIGFM